MASSLNSLPIIFLFSCFFLIGIGIGDVVVAGDVLSLEFHHRFSDTVRRWAESRSLDLPGGWPEKGSVEYYDALAAHDRSTHPELYFADGNFTFRVNVLGHLLYATVKLGTPNVTFMVALDTGSDLFWLPCHCLSCAPNYTGYPLNDYSPNVSSTSQVVSCNSSICAHQNKCSGASTGCPYSVEYATFNTSSSGFLVQDLLYLATESTTQKVVKAPIVFGCGQIQTGSFLNAIAPNGLLGLGMNNISVPSTLSSAGLISDSFSICFGGPDGIGRIKFGDKGSSDQQETKFNLRQSNATSTYKINITGMSIGNSSLNVGFSAVIDSGTSFTYLTDPAYTSLTKSFTARRQAERYDPYHGLPFEYCYYTSSNMTPIPDISFTTEGGNKFPIVDPIFFGLDMGKQSFYCLGVGKSSQLNIFGENFLTGLRLVFDRERMVLGWKKFNCYAEDSNPVPVNPQNSSASPPVALGPASHTPGPASSHLSQLKSFTSIALAFLLPLAIL